MMTPAKNGRQHRHTLSHLVGGRTQRGQSLVEMAVALIVLVPLAAGVMLLGQYIHIKQQTQAAAREAAWAATVDPALAKTQLPDQARVQAEMRSRQFADPKAAIRSDESAPSKFGDAMLTTFANQELLKTSGVSLTVYKQEAPPDYFNQGLNAIGKLTGSLGKLPPNTQGLVTAEAHARPEQIVGTNGSPLKFLDPLDTMQLDFSARTVLLADAWSAAGGGEDKEGEAVYDPSGRSVRSVIRPLVPSTWAGSDFDGGFNKVINFLGDIPIVKDVFTAGWKHFHFGRTAPDVVPADKLVKYKNAR